MLHNVILHATVEKVHAEPLPASAGSELEPGDVVATGTPGGVGHAQDKLLQSAIFGARPGTGSLFLDRPPLTEARPIDDGAASCRAY